MPPGSRVWIHAVSVGEVLAISGLVQELAIRAPEYTVVNFYDDAHGPAACT